MENRLQVKKYEDIWLLLMRVGAGAALLTHGYPKFLKLMNGNFQFGDPIGLGVHASLVLAVIAEFLCSILVILGLFTRVAVIPQMLTMLVIIFIVHGADPFNKKELPLLFFLIFGALLIFGPGRYSIDAFRRRRTV